MIAARLPHVSASPATLPPPAEAPQPALPAPAKAATSADPTGTRADRQAALAIALRDPWSLLPGTQAEDSIARDSDDPVIKVVEVEKGDTLIAILLNSGVGRADAVDAIAALGAVFRPRELQPGHEITLSFDKQRRHPSADGGLRLASLGLQPSVERDVVVNRDGSGRFVAAAIERPLELQLALAAGTIDSSLFEAGNDAAVPTDTMTQVIKAFSYDIDFEREIQPGDRFEVVYERYEDERGRLARTGDLLFASLVQNGVAREIYRFEPTDGNAGFFDARGRAVRKDLLRTPLDVVRITSKFGMRKHPILGYSKMHKGVDFAASTGTTVFAAGRGVIAKIGKLRGYGNYIRIKHDSQYATAYAHMSRLAKGLRVGKKVQQGDVIGYVGSTGMATGPHLHYEILVDGAQINPMKVKLAGRSLAGKDLRRFEALKTEMTRTRRTLADQILIARDQGR